MDGSLQNDLEQNDPDPPPGIDLSKAALPEADIAAIASNFSQPLETPLTEAMTFVVKTFSQEIQQQQLYYHGWAHVNDVARRALLIFDTVVDCCKEARQPIRENASVDWNRQRDLLNLSAIAHDMLQVFSPQISPCTARQRQSGYSEQATVDRLIGFIEQLNKTATGEPDSSHSSDSLPSSADLFSSTDIAIIREAIEATVCVYDSTEGCIYQPLLYPQHRKQESISFVAHCLALADIGTLGIDGMNAYTQEGGLLLLEENLDILAFLKNRIQFDGTFKENVRKRLLKRAQFEVLFAKSRLARLDTELKGLPECAIACLKQDVFKYLTPATIHTLETITPTAADTPLDNLLEYFQLEEAV